ncbi:MAG: FHA domain-containing protein [Gemmatimonadetes bacterium]|uniref:FHA domain-containing protein n=1 Tax=Candidatus Kutchimonas denitrificans TaxID=3056748 RepID=A0AAE4Z8J6_9BACT|nr:FHA domain-containing protein [Gemmatimonadota bacterium]NIR74637.1 FHA domain-containing protein [Candidatus Kutchimonas denitrificans]NIS02827.1 FHA domain-containing protein [Gemmatimonadota bacterium]NIT68988.1 FHA domain-containing protein [Gemmatimonadota bacterium]NIU52293.1 FHA domain-containing protein [Gemmatimonadota bacterium]
MSVGRSGANTLTIRDERIAAHHVRIERENSRHVLVVTASEAVTTLNGRPLSTGERQPLQDGDRIGLADLEFLFIGDHRIGVLSRLWVVSGVHRGKTFRIAGPEARIGRATDNDVQFPDRSVSRHHCRIVRDEDVWWIEDLESTNGTILGGAPILARRQLHHGDQIVVGYSKFVFQEGEQPLENPKLEPSPPCN